MPDSGPISTDQRLDRMEALLSRIDLAITGDGIRGVTGLVHTTQALHKRLDVVEDRTLTLENSMKAERWYGRIGAGVIGAVGAAIFGWLKSQISGGPP